MLRLLSRKIPPCSVPSTLRTVHSIRAPSGRELDEGYTPTLFELRFAEERTREAASCLGLPVLLKTFQCLGYFVRIADVPSSIVRCISKSMVLFAELIRTG